MSSMSTSGARSQFAKATIRAVIRSPRLAPEAGRAAISLIPSTAPRLAGIDRYLEWRALTAYGSSNHPVTPEEVTEFLAWRRRLRVGR